MDLVLPRPYPECLRRYLEPFGVFKPLAISWRDMSWRENWREKTSVPINMVRSLDCKEPSTVITLLETVSLHKLIPVDYGFSQIITCRELLEKLVRLYPGCTNNGYIATHIFPGEVLGREYSVSLQSGELQVGEQKALPEVIPLGFDTIFTSALNE